jgi:hypothetical protein
MFGIPVSATHAISKGKILNSSSTERGASTLEHARWQH